LIAGAFVGFGGHFVVGHVGDQDGAIYKAGIYKAGIYKDAIYKDAIYKDATINIVANYAQILDLTTICHGRTTSSLRDPPPWSSLVHHQQASSNTTTRFF
jgi:hypothetical protein